MTQVLLVNFLTHLKRQNCSCFSGSEVEDKPEAPGEAPDPQVAGLSGARPLGLGVAVLPPLPPDTAHLPFLPSAVAKRRPPTLPTVPPPPPPPPPRLDQEVCTLTQTLLYLHLA